MFASHRIIPRNALHGNLSSVSLSSLSLSSSSLPSSSLPSSSLSSLSLASSSLASSSLSSSSLSSSSLSSPQFLIRRLHRSTCFPRLFSTKLSVKHETKLTMTEQHRAPMHADALDEFQLQPQHYPLILLVVVTASLVLAYDVYYVMYLQEKPGQPLGEDAFRSYLLQSVTPVNDSTSLFRFKARIPDFADLPTPSHVVLKDDSCQVGRSFTPITYSKFSFDLLVKKYDDGLVSQYIHSLKAGDSAEIRGPILSFPYVRNMTPEIGMIAGGTGITPMYQLIKKILRDKNEESRISLIYANKNEEDILLRRELDVLSQDRPDRLKVYYVLDNPPKHWDQGKGILSKKILAEHLPNGKDSIVLVCGPDGMVKHVAGEKAAPNNQGPLLGLLKDMGKGSQSWGKGMRQFSRQINHFAGSILNRSSHLRETISIKTAPNRIIAFENGNYLSSGSSLQYVTYESISPFIKIPPASVFLGVDSLAVNYWVIDATGLPTLLEHLKTRGSFTAMRPHSLGLPLDDAAVISEARSLIDWNLRNLYCAMCGSLTAQSVGGWKRKCPLESCKTKAGKENVSFPRTDPVLIVCVVSKDHQRILLGRQSFWPPKQMSCVAGFFEPGESLEEAVAREVQEETNVKVDNIQYHSSQPWPFPSQIIFGCIAEATSENIELVDKELESANWYTKEEVSRAMNGMNNELKLPSTYSISYQLIKHVVEQKSKI